MNNRAPLTDAEILDHCRSGVIAPSGYVLRTVGEKTIAVHQREYLPALLRLLAAKET